MAVVNGVTVPDLDLDAVVRARAAAAMTTVSEDVQAVQAVLIDLLAQYDNLAGRLAILAAGVEGKGERKGYPWD